MLFFFIKMVLFFYKYTQNQNSVKSQIIQNFGQIKQMCSSNEDVLLYELDAVLTQLDKVEKSFSVVKMPTSTHILFSGLDKEKQSQFQQMISLDLNKLLKSIKDYFNNLNNELIYMKKLFEERQEDDILLSIQVLFEETKEENLVNYNDLLKILLSNIKKLKKNIAIQHKLFNINFNILVYKLYGIIQ
ncbi:hypothetical protein AB837_00434 [bacterium AB1]|nr:hypothetical protein AB837_00434 [bacterium AB1]